MEFQVFGDMAGSIVFSLAKMQKQNITVVDPSVIQQKIYRSSNISCDMINSEDLTIEHYDRGADAKKTIAIVSAKISLDSSDNQKMQDIISYLIGNKPHGIIIFANSGGHRNKNRPVFVDILQKLRAAHYFLSYGLYNSETFGVALCQEFFVIFGVYDMNLSLKSEETDFLFDIPAQPMVKKTLRQALDEANLNENDQRFIELDDPMNRILEVIKPGESINEVDEEILSSIIPRDEAIARDKRMLFRANPDRPLKYFSGTPYRPSTFIGHYEKLRSLSTQEIAVIKGIHSNYFTLENENHRAVYNELFCAIPVSLVNSSVEHLCRLIDWNGDISSVKRIVFTKSKTNNKKYCNNNVVELKNPIPIESLAPVRIAEEHKDGSEEENKITLENSSGWKERIIDFPEHYEVCEPRKKKMKKK